LYKFQNNGWTLYDYTYTGHKPGTPSDDGFFKFCVPPGTYYLKFNNPPTTLVPAVYQVGSNNSIDSDVSGAFGSGTTNMITLVCGQDRCDIGAGYYKMGSIGDHVWQDDNNNGMRESNEPGVGNIVVRAYDQNGAMLGSSTTDQNGNYMIDYLGKNNYYLQFDMPLGYTVTTPNMGGDESLDSDVDNSNGPSTTKWYQVQPGEHMPNVDAGVIFEPLPVVWLDIWGEDQTTHNYVEWSVASEVNVSHYEVQKSMDNAEDFVTIGKVLSTEEEDTEIIYSYEDYDNKVSGVYYYRIKQFDYNGQFDYSKIISINKDAADEGTNTAEMYPNPVVNELTIELDVKKSIDELSVDIHDATGKLVRKNMIMDIALDQGIKKYKVNVSDMAKGVYSVQIKLDNQTIVKKLIVVSN